MWPQPGGINSEFNCVAISMTVKNRFAGMVEYEVGKVGRQWALMCRWQLPGMGEEKRSSWLPFDGILEVWRSERAGTRSSGRQVGNLGR